MSAHHETARPLLQSVVLAITAFLLSGCPGDASDGAAPLLRFRSTPECLIFPGGFPPGLIGLDAAGSEAAVVQFIPTAVLGVDLDSEPPALLATNPIPAFAELPSPRCGGMQVDSDLDGHPDPDRSDALGFRCLPPAAGGLRRFAEETVALVTSGYEQVLLLDPQSGEQRLARLDTPPAAADFDPADWPFWPAPGSMPFQAGFSTRACVYADGVVDSLGNPIGANARCDPNRDGFATTFTADALRIGNRLFVATSNLLTSSTARYAPGTVLVFDLDPTTTPLTVAPSTTRAVIMTTGFNPTSLTSYTTPAGRELVLIGVTGALAIGTGPGLVRTESSIDVLDATTLELVATIPLGLAGLGFNGLSIDPSRRVALAGAAVARALYAIDLAVLDDPNLGLGPGPLPVRLDGSAPGFRDARVLDASDPYLLPRRATGPPDSVCSTRSSVAIQADAFRAVASDFCDGTISLLELAVPSARSTPIDATGLLTLARVSEVAAPLDSASIGQIRAIDRVLIRPGTPGLDYTGPDVHFTAGLPEGALCGVRINAL